jgi:hypothetical protein
LVGSRRQICPEAAPADPPLGVAQGWVNRWAFGPSGQLRAEAEKRLHDLQAP